MVGSQHQSGGVEDDTRTDSTAGVKTAEKIDLHDCGAECLGHRSRGARGGVNQCCGFAAVDTG